MDQNKSRGRLLTNFRGHWSIHSLPENQAPNDWSIRVPPAIHLDQSLPNLCESSSLLGCCRGTSARKTRAISTWKSLSQKLSNSWSTSSQPDFVRALGRIKTARNRQGKILYTEVHRSWLTLGQDFSGNPNPWYFVPAVQMGGVLPYK